MKGYNPEDPSFHESINIYEQSDLVDADTVDNIPLMQLHDNSKYLKKVIDEGISFEEATHQDVLDIIQGYWKEDDSDDTGEIDDDGTIIEEATQEDIENIKLSYWQD